MSIGARAGPATYLHEAVIYDSDAELLDAVVPFLDEGGRAGEPTFAALADHEAIVVGSALAEPAGVTFLPALGGDERPPTAIKRLRALLEGVAAVGQIRLVKSVPHPGVGASWYPWCRYEAAINELFSDLPVWEMCLYDRRITPRSVVDDVERTHPRITTSRGSHLISGRYQDPRAFVGSMPPSPPDPLEAGRPVTELVDPSAAAARHAVENAAAHTRLAKEEIGRLVLAVSEVVTNAILHGQPPVTMRLWTGPERIVLTVNDRGPGPAHPYTGLIPVPPVNDYGGLGLWITHQLVTTSYSRDRDGFTVRLVAGDGVR